MQRTGHGLLGARVAALALSLGCAGQIVPLDEAGPTGAGGTRSGGTGATGGSKAPGSSSGGDGGPAFVPTTSFQLRRLTTEQYKATVETLLGGSTAGMPSVERVSPSAGFSAIGASTASVSGAGVGQFEDAARFLAAAAFAPTLRQKLVPCTPKGPTDTACIGSFVTAFRQRIFRRPLTTDEVMRYTTAAAQVGMATNDVWQGLEAITSAFLQSPHFLYLTEVGVPDPQKAGRYRLTGYEMAARLSYFLTNDTPDDALLAAAASNALGTPQGVEAQAARLLASPAARDTLRSFFTTLLSLDNLDTLARPKELFPKFSPTLG